MPNQIDAASVLAAQRACEELVIRYTHIADFGPGTTMAEIFTEDGEWTTGQERYAGREQLTKFFGRDKGHAKSRHVSSNVLITVTDEDNAEGLSYFTLYRYAEEKPRVPDLADQPVIVGEYRDQFRRQADVGFVRRAGLK